MSPRPVLPPQVLAADGDQWERGPQESGGPSPCWCTRQVPTPKARARCPSSCSIEFLLSSQSKALPQHLRPFSLADSSDTLSDPPPPLPSIALLQVRVVPSRLCTNFLFSLLLFLLLKTFLHKRGRPGQTIIQKSESCILRLCVQQLKVGPRLPFRSHLCHLGLCAAAHCCGRRVSWSRWALADSQAVSTPPVRTAQPATSTHQVPCIATLPSSK